MILFSQTAFRGTLLAGYTRGPELSGALAHPIAVVWWEHLGGQAMIISVINHTNGQITDEELQHAIRVMNRQITEDYSPYWSLGATLRLDSLPDTFISHLETSS